MIDSNPTTRHSSAMVSVFLTLCCLLVCTGVSADGRIGPWGSATAGSGLAAFHDVSGLERAGDDDVGRPCQPLPAQFECDTAPLEASDGEHDSDGSSTASDHPDAGSCRRQDMVDLRVRRKARGAYRGQGPPGSP
jgi:hypothetical protein